MLIGSLSITGISAEAASGSYLRLGGRRDQSEFPLISLKQFAEEANILFRGIPESAFHIGVPGEQSFPVSLVAIAQIVCFLRRQIANDSRRNVLTDEDRIVELK